MGERKMRWKLEKIAKEKKEKGKRKAERIWERGMG